MTNNTLNEIKKVYREWHVAIVSGLLDQILKSPEMISDTNRLSNTEIARIKQDQTKIVTRALDKEIDYLIKKHKIRTMQDLSKVITEMDDDKIKAMRKKFLTQVIRETSTHG